MPIELTYFPHGTSTDNEKGICSGWSDAELSELGKRQLQGLKKELTGRKFELVFCSDLKRAVDTAKLLFSGAAQIIPDSRLRECNYGEYNGRHSSLVEPLLRERISEVFPGGESCDNVKVRVEDLLRFLKEEHDGKSVALVSHRVPQLALEVLLNGKTWESAFEEDWRKTRVLKPGWIYLVK